MGPSSSSGTWLIPAHAGSTLLGNHCEQGLRAHPRSRGEHHPVHLARLLGIGSSPLTRGAPCPVFPSRDVARLIPAHAGSTIE